MQSQRAMRCFPVCALAFLAGCQAAEYAPPRWDPPARAVVSVGCVDFVPYLFTDGVGKVPGIPFAISFHSDCKENAALDLARIRVRARVDDGAWSELAPYDPRHEIHRAELAPDDTATEWIEFVPPRGATVAWTHACVDFGAVLADRPPRAVPPICMDVHAKIEPPPSSDGWLP